MTSTLASLEGKLTRIQRCAIFQPKAHCFILEAGQKLTTAQRAKIRPGDQVVIREYPRGFIDRV